MQESIITKENEIFIEIPKNAKLEKPIVIDTSKIDKINVIANQNSEAIIIEDIKSNDSAAKVDVKENAKIAYVTIQNLNESTNNSSKRIGCVERDGRLYWFDFCIGGKTIESDTKTDLIGDGAEAKNWGIFFGNKEQQFKINNLIIHSEKNTNSDMLMNGALADSSRSNYNGLIRIQPGATGSEGFQKENTLLLSEDSRADVVPNLEINNDDVKCGHGASIGQIDKEQIFYMMSRGINEITAKKHITIGFFDGILTGMTDEGLKQRIEETIYKKIEAIF